MARRQTIPEDEQSKQLRYYHRRQRDKRYTKALKSDLTRFLLSRLKHKRYQAKKQGIPFDLDEEWVLRQPQMCAVTGQMFVINEQGTGPRAPSFDQISPSAGYTKENTQLVCMWYNTAKGAWTEDEIRGLIVEAAAVFK